MSPEAGADTRMSLWGLSGGGLEGLQTSADLWPDRRDDAGAEVRARLRRDAGWRDAGKRPDAVRMALWRLASSAEVSVRCVLVCMLRSAGDGTPSGPHGLELRSDTDTGSPDVAWELRKSVRALELMLEASAGAV